MTRGTHPVTLNDVAERADVSVATVSRALSGDPQISEATRERVRSIARDLGYVPNVAAQNLVRRQSTTLGLMTPDVTDPVHGQIVTGFQQRAAEMGYAVILANGHSDPEEERRALRALSAHRVAGAALMGSVLPQREVVDAMAPSSVCFIGSEDVAHAGAEPDMPTGCLRADDRDGMRQVVEHLCAAGYRAPAYVGGHVSASFEIRRRAFVDAAVASGVLGPPAVHPVPALERRALQPLARQLRTDGIDVAVCYDDKTALHVMDALRSVGARIPHDIGVVGFDDISFAAIAHPQLTTVAQPAEAMGRDGLDMLLAGLGSGALPPSRRVPVRLIVRESTALRRPGGSNLE